MTVSSHKESKTIVKPSSNFQFQTTTKLKSWTNLWKWENKNLVKKYKQLSGLAILVWMREGFIPTIQLKIRISVQRMKKWPSNMMFKGWLKKSLIWHSEEVLVLSIHLLLWHLCSVNLLKLNKLDKRIKTFSDQAILIIKWWRRSAKTCKVHKLNQSKKGRILHKQAHQLQIHSALSLHKLLRIMLRKKKMTKWWEIFQITVLS